MSHISSPAGRYGFTYGILFHKVSLSVNRQYIQIIINFYDKIAI